MIFLSVESRSPSRRRRLTLAGVLVLGALTAGTARPLSPDSAEWDLGATPRNLPTLDWAATPPSLPHELSRQPLDMGYPEVAALLKDRMGRQERPEKIRATANQIVRLCHLLGFQPSFILAVIEHESTFRSRIESPAGAVGLMQLLPATARVVGSRLGIAVPPGGPNLKDPVVNVTLGIHYLAELRQDFKTLASTLAAYNLGPAQWARHLSRPGGQRPQSVAKYVALIERTTTEIREAGRSAWKPRLAARLAPPVIR